jgi:hypothetical protein
MRDLVNWKDHVVEYPGRFQEEDLGDSLKQLTPSPGEVRQQGTPQNATNFNTMDYAALEAMLMSAEAVRKLRHHEDTLDGITSTIIPVTLVNTLAYPFNNSKATVKLPTERNTKDYTVDIDVVSVTGGAVGDFEISDKLLNGFKIAYTGSATQVVINCFIRGGI